MIQVLLEVGGWLDGYICDRYPNSHMSEGIVVSVITGLAVGIAFVVIVTVLMSPLTVFPANIKLKEAFGDLEGQQKAIDILLSDRDVRTFIASKNFEVWAYGATFPQASLNQGICDKDECTLIGIRESHTDGSVDCALKTFVNTETRQVDRVFYSRPCDEESR